MIREELSKKVQERLRALDLPSEYYCKKCDFPVIDEETAGMIEMKHGGYYDICQCDKPEPFEKMFKIDEIIKGVLPDRFFYLWGIVILTGIICISLAVGYYMGMESGLEIFETVYKNCMENLW